MAQVMITAFIGLGFIRYGMASNRIVIDTTTADPSSTAIVADELAAKGATPVVASLGRTERGPSQHA